MAHIAMWDINVFGKVGTLIQTDSTRSYPWINDKNCSLCTVLTATHLKLQKSLQRDSAHHHVANIST